MSGNVSEFTTTLQTANYYASYRRYGGNYSCSSSEITKTSYTYQNTDYDTNAYSDTGFRIILTCK